MQPRATFSNLIRNRLNSNLSIIDSTSKKIVQVDSRLHSKSKSSFVNISCQTNFSFLSRLGGPSQKKSEKVVRKIPKCSCHCQLKSNSNPIGQRSAHLLAQYQRGSSGGGPVVACQPLMLRNSAASSCLLPMVLRALTCD